MKDADHIAPIAPAKRIGLRRALAVAGAIGASMSCGELLRGASTRADASAVAGFAWAWGLAALLAIGLEASTPALVAIALAVRLPLVGVPPVLSDDVWRYLWEGKALAHGIDPFVVAPAAVDGLDDALRARVNHPDLPSIYPPVALAWFRLLALGGQVGTAQLAAITADLATVIAVARLTRRRGSAWPALVYALHPLPALEYGANAHLEALGVALCAWAVVLWDEGSEAAGAALAVLAGATKLLPALLLPAMRTRRSAVGAAAGAAISLALAAPVLAAGPALLTSFGAYASTWSFNGFAYTLARPWLGDATRVVLVAVGAVAVGLAAWRPDPLRLWAVAGGAFVLLSPTAHPWYAAWALVPSLMLGRWGWAGASTALLGSYLVLSTWNAETASWTEPPWLWAATWGPAVAWLLADAIASRRLAPPTSE